MLRTAANAELPSELQVHDYLIAQGHPHGLQTVWPFAGRRLDVYKLFSTVVIAGGSEQVRPFPCLRSLATMVLLPLGDLARLVAMYRRDAHVGCP